MKKTFALFYCVLLSTSIHALDSSLDVAPSSSVALDPKIESKIDHILNKMTLEQKVSNLFVTRPDVIDPSIPKKLIDVQKTQGSTRVTKKSRAYYKKYPIGGFILFPKNMTGDKQLRKYTKKLHKLKGRPLLFIDEEGGRVARIGNHDSFSVPVYKDMLNECNGSHSRAFQVGEGIGKYLHHYGLDVDFAPVSDVNSNPKNPVIGSRSFSSKPEEVSAMSLRMLQGLRSQKVDGCLKHFPGHGDTKTDSHLGYAEVRKTWSDMNKCELLPFINGINNGCSFIMTAHITLPEVEDNAGPCTLSPYIIEEKLRKEMGYDGIVVTDALNMGAITKENTPEESSVKAILAGCDFLLMPQDFERSYNGLLEACKDGRVSQERLDRSLRRILRYKLKNNLV